MTDIFTSNAPLHSLRKQKERKTGRRYGDSKKKEKCSGRKNLLKCAVYCIPFPFSLLSPYFCFQRESVEKMVGQPRRSALPADFAYRVWNVEELCLTAGRK